MALLLYAAAAILLDHEWKTENRKMFRNRSGRSSSEFCCGRLSSWVSTSFTCECQQSVPLRVLLPNVVLPDVSNSGSGPQTLVLDDGDTHYLYLRTYMQRMVHR